MVIFIGLTPGKNAVAQTGAVDTNFNIGTGLAGSFVHALAVNADGQILAGGNFTRVQGGQRNHVAQFNADGSLDLGFSPAPGANGEVLAVAYQPDRKALIGGGFTRVNNTNRNHVARFNIDGTLDSSFDPGSGANNNVRGLAVQPGSKVLIVGEFTRYNGITNNCVARLNPDGTLDQSFRAGVGVGGNRFVEEVRLLADGKILIAGDFSSYNGTPRASIARLNPDGSLDAAFDPGAGAKPLDPILGMTIQPDGRILIVGSFTGINRKPLKNLARLNADGSLDSSFNPGSGTAGGPIAGLLNAVAVEPDGKILIGGWFDKVNGISRSFLARLNPDGKPETNWNVRVDGQVRAIAIESDHKILFGGDFARVNALPSNHLARLNASQPVPARLKTCAWPNDGTIQFELVGDATRQYLLQTSDNLVDWQTWTNVTCSDGIVPLADPDVAHRPCRFYRALLVNH